MGELYIGTSGFTYKDWRGIFYPKGVAQKDWLAFYAQHYNTVEINATFYRPFPATVYQRWHDVTPDPFRFTLKGPKLITHEKQLLDVTDDLRAFIQSTSVLEDKLAVMLWQFPSQAHADELQDRFTKFLRLLPTTIRQVFEFRHASWFNERIYDLLNQHGAGFVVNDSSRFPAREVITGNFMYVRFHGPKQLYASLYSSEAMEKWAGKIKLHLQDYDVYAYFNNDFGGRALQNANELSHLLAQAGSKKLLSEPQT